MGTKNPEKLDMKALQSKFDASLNLKPKEPLLPNSHKKSPVPKQDRPMFGTSTSRTTIKPPKTPPQAAKSKPPPTVAKPKPPATALKPPPKALKPPPKALKPSVNFKNELIATLNAPQYQGVSKVSLPQGSGVPQRHPPVISVQPQVQPVPQPPVEDEPSVTYKGHILPNSVEIDGTCYKLSLLQDCTVGVPSRPPRPAEVQCIIPKDADADELYDNNFNLMSNMQIKPDDSDEEADFERRGIEAACDEDYDDCSAESDVRQQSCNQYPGDNDVDEENYDDCNVEQEVHKR